MAAFKQLLASFLTATNENNAALASVKFDFSLIQVKAPSQWSPVGQALTEWRRADAEVGPLHRTARRLAALFEDMAPSTPRLVAAYGTRVSEIITTPGVNPSGKASDGPFARYVGAEGTAMWAAATSGTGAIAVYLLACFLARAWDAKKAISIWTELVHERKSQIKNAVNNNEKVSESSLMGTLQEITRDDLAVWDASARSWLRSGDHAKQLELMQLQIITKDVGLQFNGGTSTYEGVISSWTQALVGLENFLLDMPQQITDASVLLAFSAWHLFPDLIPLAGNTPRVRFKDSLFPANAIGTIGIYPADNRQAKGIRWSLMLSHLQYYGEPVQVICHETPPRVDFSQLRLAILGCLFFKWRVRQRDFIAAATLLTTLWEVLLKNKERPVGISVERQFGWLFVFVQASHDLLESQRLSRSDFREHVKLVSFGYRHGEGFLGPAEKNFGPFFGLCNIHILSGLQECTDVNFGHTYLTSIVNDNDISNQNGFIVRGYLDDADRGDKRDLYCEFIALHHHTIPTQENTSAGKIVVQTKRPCWLLADRKSYNISTSSTYSLVSRRMAEWTVSGYSPTLIFDGPREKGSNRQPTYYWSKAPRFFTEPCANAPNNHAEEHSAELSECRCFEDAEDVHFSIALGSWRCGICVTSPSKFATGKSVSLQECIDKLRTKVDPGTLWSYMACLVDESWLDENDRDGCHPKTFQASNIAATLASTDFRFSLETCRALHSLAAAQQVFDAMKSRTLSLDCISYPMYEVQWQPKIAPRATLQTTKDDNGNEALPAYSRMHTPMHEPLDRACTFSCIVYFDTGNIDLEPEDLVNVFAASCGNSLYVAGVILSDPADYQPDYRIRHLVGNIGRKGVSLLIAPRDPRIRPLGKDYRLVNHEPYDYKREDNFQGTTLHLEFTEWVQALIYDDSTRTIDQDVYLVESIISVRDRGAWVADLDILEIKPLELSLFIPRSCSRIHVDDENDVDNEYHDYISIDSWEELLDSPPSTGIVRAHGNWAARLAATSILFQQERGYCVGLLPRGNICLKCMTMDMLAQVGNAGLRDYESVLPQFLID